MDDVTRRVLELESEWFRTVSGKEQAIRDRLDMSLTRYAQILVAALSDPQARLAFPMVLARVERRREAGLRARSARRAG